MPVNIRSKDSIPPHVLKRLLITEAEYERCDTLLLQKALCSMPNLVYCPNRVIGWLHERLGQQCTIMPRMLLRPLFAVRDVAERERQMADMQPERLMRNAAHTPHRFYR
jgi:uncharacterized Fe-S radical SAM superfamily protein PflX